MISFQLTPPDLARMRFGYSPLIETAMSFLLLQMHRNTDTRFTGKHKIPAHYLPWADSSLAKLEAIPLPYMEAVISPSHATADFVTPNPANRSLPFEQELQQVLLTPHEIVYHSIEHLNAIDGYDIPERRHFMTAPDEALCLLVQELDLYWHTILEPYWLNLQNTLENEVMFRARLLAAKGAGCVLSMMDTRAKFDSDTLILQKGLHKDENYQLDGRGVQIVPSLFATPDGVMYQLNKLWEPMFIYSSRGAGLWYQPSSVEPDEALELTMGAAKARILHALTVPTSTGQLAEQLHVTAGSISQQMGKLSQAGLVESHRSGSRVYYRLSPRGQDLLAVFSN